MGLVSEKCDAQSMFYRLTQTRLACKEEHAKIDCSQKVAAVIARKAAPLPGNYAVGDLISFKREAGAETPQDKWSSATRIIGFDGPKVVWGINESIPVSLALDKIRPATPEQALAYMYAHGHLAILLTPLLGYTWSFC